MSTNPDIKLYLELASSFINRAGNAAQTEDDWDEINGFALITFCSLFAEAANSEHDERKLIAIIQSELRECLSERDFPTVGNA